MTSKLVYRRFVSFSIRFADAITHSGIGLPRLLCGSARGGERLSAKPARFAAAKTAILSHKPTQRQSAERSFAGLRSKLKKGCGNRGRACSHTGVQPLFHIDCCDKIAAK